MMNETTICRKKPEEIRNEVPETAGLTAPESDHVTCVQRSQGRPAIMAWVSDELLAKTKQVWSNAYGRSITEDEAMEILMNVKHLAEALAKAKQGE